MMLSVDAATANIVQCNQTWANVIGRLKEEIVGRPVFHLFADESASFGQSHVFPGFVSTGQIIDQDLVVQCQDGTTRDVILNATSVRDAAGKILMSRSVFSDVTERRRTESALRESEKRFRQLAENMHAVLWMRSAAGAEQL